MRLLSVQGMKLSTNQDKDHEKIHCQISRYRLRSDVRPQQSVPGSRVAYHFQFRKGSTLLCA